MSNANTLFIVDGSAYIYRAFFAVRHLSNSKGMPTNALHGFMQMLKWSIAALGLIVLALYAFIEAGQPLIGTLLLLLIPVGAIGLVVMGTRRT